MRKLIRLLEDHYKIEYHAYYSASKAWVSVSCLNTDESVGLGHILTGKHAIGLDYPISIRLTYKALLHEYRGL